MPGSDPELERLKRLRERQLTDRDPLVKQRQFQRSSAQREKKLKKPYPSLSLSCSESSSAGPSIPAKISKT